MSKNRVENSDGSVTQSGHWFFNKDVDCKGPAKCPYCELNNSCTSTQDQLIGKIMQLIEAALPESKQTEAFKEMLKDIVYSSINYHRELIMSDYYRFVPKHSGSEEA